MHRAIVYLTRNNALVWEGCDENPARLQERCETECHRVRELYFQFVIGGGERISFEEMFRRSQDNLVAWRMEYKIAEPPKG